MQLLLKPDATSGAHALQTKLTKALTAGKSVLWFIPGGSNIPVAVSVMAGIPADLTSKLTISLSDERYGPIGHDDSNWKQLDNYGFDCKLATRIEVLTGQELSATVAAFDQTVGELLQSHDVVIGFYGMGADGHIAGILPGSEAADARGYATGYTTEQFVRITTTFDTIKRCNAAFLLAFGVGKRPALETLQTDVPLAIQPVQVLKSVPEAYVYNDQIGDQV